MQKKNQSFLRPLAQGAVLERLQRDGLFIHPRTERIGEDTVEVWFANVALSDREADILLRSICRFWMWGGRKGVEVSCLGPVDHDGSALCSPEDRVCKVSYLYRVFDERAADLAVWLRAHADTPFDFPETIVVNVGHEERSC